MREAERVFLWIIKIGLWVIPFLPLYISPSMLFPFITGKNFTFRIIIEIIFALWVGLAVLRPHYRPKLTPLFKAVTVFIVILFFADLFSPNPYRSFFSNYERMEGFMMLGHLYLYFVMLSSVFTKRDWIVFFHMTLLASIAVSYVALLQKLGFKVSMQGGFRVDSTIGNPTYLAAYLLFHFWLLLILMYQYWRKWWLEIIYGIILIFELAIIYFTATRGAALAIAAVSVPFLGATVLWWPRIMEGLGKDSGISGEKKSSSAGETPYPLGRKLAAALFGAMILLPILLWTVRKADFIQSNQVLRRLTNYSFQEDTIQARFRIWNMSWQGFKERPILGWGQENYYLVFQKYFDPGLWSQEPWFDRSHNLFFDWLIHAGILGLASFLSIFFFAAWGILRGMKNKMLPFWHGMVLCGLFATHFLQNIFVFDNLNTYLLFFGFLAYSNSLIHPSLFQMVGVHAASSLPQPLGALEHSFASARKQPVAQPSYGRAYAIGAGLLIMVWIASTWLHVRPMRQSKALIQALQVFQYQGNMDQILGLFRQAVGYNSFGTAEAREQIANIARGLPGNERFSAEEQKKFIEFAIEELKKETANPAKDVKHMLFLGAMLNRTLNLNPEYRKLAQQVLEEAARLSPAKQVVLFELAQYYALVGNVDAATDVLYKAWKTDPSYREARVNLWIVSALSKKPEIAKEVASRSSLEDLGDTDLYRIGQAYQSIEDYTSALPVYARLVKVSPKNGKYRATYAALLANAGRIEEARQEAEEAAKLDPEAAKELDVFIGRLKNK